MLLVCCSLADHYSLPIPLISSGQLRLHPSNSSVRGAAALGECVPHLADHARLRLLVMKTLAADGVGGIAPFLQAGEHCVGAPSAASRRGGLLAVNGLGGVHDD